MSDIVSKGYLYIADGINYIKEAEMSAFSLKCHTSFPIALLTSQNYVSNVFDMVLVDKDISEKRFASKAIGLSKSPFDKTIYLDGDTYIVDSIDDLFLPLEKFDFGASIEKGIHTNMSEPLNKNIVYYGIIPEFNTGILVFKKSDRIYQFLLDWVDICLHSSEIADMPHFRTAFLNNSDLKYFIIPDEFNSHGFSNYLILYNKVKVIHERLGRKYNSITPYMLDSNEMKKFATKINTLITKRLYIPKIGILPYQLNLDYMIRKLKKIFGAGYHSKRTGEFKRFINRSN